MKQVLWIIQTNLGSQSDIGVFVEAVRRSGSLVEEISAIPFTGDLPEYLPAVNYDGPVVLNGSVSFVTGAHESGRWRPGAFSDPDTFTYQKWVHYYGDLLLNSPDGTSITTVREFVNSPLDDDKWIFVRPVRDAKEINGEAQTVASFRKFCVSAALGEFAGVGPDTVVVVGEPWGIEGEWRMFMRKGKVIASSQYRKNGQFKKIKGTPSDLIAFGEMAATRWNPCPMYVMDVCLSAGNPYIMEVQGFNSAGHYAADMDAVVAAANEAALEIY